VDTGVTGEVTAVKVVAVAATAVMAVKVEVATEMAMEVAVKVEVATEMAMEVAGMETEGPVVKVTAAEMGAGEEEMENTPEPMFGI